MLFKPEMLLWYCSTGEFGFYLELVVGSLENYKEHFACKVQLVDFFPPTFFLQRLSPSQTYRQLNFNWSLHFNFVPLRLLKIKIALPFYSLNLESKLLHFIVYIQSLFIFKICIDLFYMTSLQGGWGKFAKLYLGCEVTMHTRRDICMCVVFCYFFYIFVGRKRLGDLICCYM